MSSTWGNNIKLSIFGESHGPAIGINIGGLPPGIELDLEEIKMEMKRRAPGQNQLSTPRAEKDEFEILSGFFNKKTTGTPLSMIIRNTDTRSKDYSRTKDLARPGHADYTGDIRYFGHNDYRGSGHFSGRITASIVFAGAIAKQILRRKNIYVGSHIKSIGDIEEDYFDSLALRPELIEELRNKRFPVLDDKMGELMEEAILKAKEDEDSVGGILEVAVVNHPAGLGSPFFESVESNLAHMIFSIPATKGIEFGAGFNITKMKGSQANDEYFMDGDKVNAYSNNNGGIIGGITNGLPIIFRVGIKPTASIGKKQRTIDMVNKEDVEIEVVGRHDPCIVLRAAPVIEAATALVILDQLLEVKVDHDLFRRP
ncbi:chorismate synthase [Tissierella creatinini]|nr:chorismate synthase [Tissierella creatinini]TJX61496.1 chorismate synthase [Soehngenia saccharolytica]